MRIRTQRFVLTISGDSSAVELDITTATPTIKLLQPNNIKLNLEEILPSQAESETDTKSLKDRALDVLNRKRQIKAFPAKQVEQTAAETSPKNIGLPKRKVWTWYLHLDLNEALGLIQKTSPYAIAQSINSYQNLTHVAAALELFSSPQLPNTVISRVQRRFRSPISVFQRPCYLIPRELGLISVVPIGIETSYLITELGKEVLAQLNEIQRLNKKARWDKMEAVMTRLYQKDPVNQSQSKK